MARTWVGIVDAKHSACHTHVAAPGVSAKRALWERDAGVDVIAGRAHPMMRSHEVVFECLSVRERYSAWAVQRSLMRVIPPLPWANKLALKHGGRLPHIVVSHGVVVPERLRMRVKHLLPLLDATDDARAVEQQLERVHRRHGRDPLPSLLCRSSSCNEASNHSLDMLRSVDLRPGEGEAPTNTRAGRIRMLGEFTSLRTAQPQWSLPQRGCK